MKRHLLSLVALAAAASFAGAQQPATTATHGDSTSAMHRNARAGMKHHKTTRHTRSSSGGEVALDPGVSAGGPGYSVHAVSRDFVGADESKCDALCQRERKMDAACGKSREKCGRP